MPGKQSTPFWEINLQSFARLYADRGQAVSRRDINFGGDDWLWDQIDAGYIVEDGGYYELTEKGANVLSRMKNPRRRNPVPPSSVLQAERLYRAFTGDEPTQELIIEAPEIPALAVAIGTVDAIAYTTVRDGKVEHYQHEFAQHARPIFAVSPDGRQLLVLHGNYTFTERGIVDGRKPRK